MRASRQRAVIEPVSRPRLHAHVRLQFDPVRARWALLSPEKVLWPDETSLDILRLMDGRSVAEMAIALAGEYDAPAEDIEADVLDFVQEWSDRMLVRS